ncbi:30S ribosomal protein S17 [Candidatus Peregrinibacteria bacterium]|nr:30S ribosomal protein S17 [Candidatus Peregrinibacteria bacterium]
MRKITGIVTSKKMDKTLVVTANRYKNHPKYKKRYRISKKYFAHNPNNEYEVGDKITIYETTPLSKLKKWTVEMPKGEKKEKEPKETNA